MDENKLFKSLWDLLVPPDEKAETAQGEVIRIAGRVQHEVLVQLLKDNGDKGFIDDRLTTVLCSCAVDWVKRNPNPEDIPLLDTDYNR